MTVLRTRLSDGTVVDVPTVDPANASTPYVTQRDETGTKHAIELVDPANASDQSVRFRDDTGTVWAVEPGSSGSATIPSSVEHQWRVEEFASPWPANVGSQDMTVNGLTQGTMSSSDGVVGDGASDHGLATGPETYGGNETWGVAFTFNTSNMADTDAFGGLKDGNNQLLFYFTDFGGAGTVGAPTVNVTDSNANTLAVQTSSTFDDGNNHAVVINKSGDSASSIEIFVDDMTSAQSKNTLQNQAFDNTAFSTTLDFAFWARNNGGSIDSHADVAQGVWEFNSAPYTQSEREDFVTRRPEV